MAKDSKETPVYKKWWFWVIIVLIIIIAGGAAGSANKDPKKVGETGSAGDEIAEQVASDAEKTFKVGDVISIDDQEMTINSVERDWKTRNEYIKAKDGKEYVRLNVTLKNNSNDKISYYSSYWTMEDSDGAIENSTIVVGDDDTLSYGELAAGGKKSGNLIFEMPKGANGLKVHYKPSFWSGDREAIIEL